jgi:hypothetical protein
MASIGGFTFLQMTGSLLPNISARVRLLDRPGVDSIGNRNEGSKGKPAEVRTVEGYTALVNANAAVDDYEALKGSYLTVVTDQSRTITNVLVVEVTGVRVQQVANATTSGVNYIVTANWQLMPTV